MIRISPGDLIALSANGHFYYAAILPGRRLFGGNWTYAFHRKSQTLLTAEEILRGPRSGFNAFVDFIWAKRENRATRLAKKINTTTFEGPGFLKKANTHKSKASLWFVYDMQFCEIRRTPILNAAEARYPLMSRIDDVLMTRLIDQRWTPEIDKRI